MSGHFGDSTEQASVPQPVDVGDVAEYTPGDPLIPGSSSQVSVHSSVSLQQPQQEEHAHSVWGHQEDPQSEILQCSCTTPLVFLTPYVCTSTTCVSDLLQFGCALPPQLLRLNPFLKAPPLLASHPSLRAVGMVTCPVATECSRLKHQPPLNLLLVAPIRTTLDMSSSTASRLVRSKAMVPHPLKVM